MTRSQGEVKEGGQQRLQLGLILIGLLLANGVIYFQTLGFDFVNSDDHVYVSENLRVQRGLSFENLIWAFTTTSQANWHPLTWLSHMLDIEIYGLDPGGHHLSNVLLHGVNTLLLFGLLYSLTAAHWKSACVALLFAIHPLHVESVAWVSERKDVLCAFFWLLSLWSYARRVGGGGPTSLTLPWLLAACALLAKPMAVTLPLTLLLLDYWPLGRLDRRSLWPLLGEKLPFLGLSLASSLITLMAQSAGGAMESSSAVALGARLANAAVSYASYLAKFAWPVDLALLYPHPYIPGTGGVAWAGWQIAGSLVLLLGVTALAAIWKRGYFTTGWLWYLGTLVPVIGLVQVGTQAFADRYSYIPLIGLCVALVWGAAEVFGRMTKGRSWLRAVGLCLVVAWLGALGALSFRQAGHWRGSVPLFEQALRVAPDNTIAHLALATSLLAEGRLDEAMAHASRTLELKPDYGEAHATIGHLQRLQGRHEEALRSLQRAVDLSPYSADLHANLASQMLLLGRVENSLQHYGMAARLSPDWPQWQLAQAEILSQQGDFARAVEHYREALQIEPQLTAAQLGLAEAFVQQGRRADAIAVYQLILARDSQQAKALYGLERARRLPETAP